MTESGEVDLLRGPWLLTRIRKFQVRDYLSSGIPVIVIETLVALGYNQPLYLPLTDSCGRPLYHSKTINPAGWLVRRSSSYQSHLCIEDLDSWREDQTLVIAGTPD